MRTLLVVNGEEFWPAYFPDFAVQRARLQETRWLWHDGVLRVFASGREVRPDVVLWRLGAVRPHPNHRAVLEMLRFAGVPCVNSAQSLLRGYDRLGMLNELRELGLPLLPQTWAVSDALHNFEPTLPCVLKLGNLHGGWGKARVETLEQWRDLADVAFAANDYATVEPFTDYTRDVRVLAIGDQLWTMARQSANWKVNRGKADYELIAPPAELEAATRRALAHWKADALALDWIETRDGNWFVLEANDVPGLSGFPDACRHALAARVRLQNP